MGSAATLAVAKMMSGATGLPFTVANLAYREQVKLATIEASQVKAQQVAFETVEKSAGVQYPVVYVYCEGLSNLLREKFRTFSGKAFMVAEVRATHDRLEGLAQDVQLYAAAVAEVLDSNRGNWDEGMFYTGGYKVDFGPIKHGGKNFIQVAKISFEVEVSR